ncbi:MAG TPA: ABC transporter ATP-binding protein [Solirubrobacteraceae bacterium]|nr:ABC transporter ATP-binding protein [Solirubrobacteraceae bacterium]
MIEIQNVTKRFGGVTAVDDVSLTIAENEFFALLGPSGCGKTTLLRMLAGFEEPDSGVLSLDGSDLIGVKPYKRPLNMMFQSYALFPHMSVLDNVAYGLKMEGVKKAEARSRAAEALEQVQLGHTASRRPAQLSGGQRQRVALARALVKRPRVLLLDEPLSALDRQIRGEMQIELKRLQHQVGITFVVVTHDQEEALTMADRIAVLRDGHVEQVGAPDELYERPATRFVAGFLGDANLFPAGTQGEEIVVRPERLRLALAADASSLVGLADTRSGRIAEVAYLGTARKYVIDLKGGGTAQARVASVDDTRPLTAGDEVVVGWAPADGVVVDAGGAPVPAVAETVHA